MSTHWCAPSNNNNWVDIDLGNSCTISKSVKRHAGDAGGNILSKSEYPYTTAIILAGTPTSYSYEYGDINRKDKSTKINGKDITYDAIGNPLTYSAIHIRGRTADN